MEEDFKLLEEMKNNCLTKRDYIDEKAERKAQAIENLINKYKEQEKMIELMAECLAEGDCDLMCSECGCYKCEAEIDVVMECIKKHFKKKAKGE